MAYKTVYGYQTVNAGGSYPYTKDAAIKVKDTMVAMGWTLVYDGSGDNPPKYVLKSAGGESGTKMDAYVGVFWSGTNYTNRIIFVPYVYWNTNNNTGYCYMQDSYGSPYNYLRLSCYDSSTFYLWVYGDKDGVIVVTKSGTTYHVGGALYAKPWYTKGSALTSDSPAGTYPLSNAEISVADATQFTAGATYQICGTFDNGGVTQGAKENVVVNTVNTQSNILTITTLNKKYLTGARIGQTPYSFGTITDWQYVNSGTATANGMTFQSPGQWAFTGSGASGNYCVWYWLNGSPSTDSPNIRGEGLWTLNIFGFSYEYNNTYTLQNSYGWCYVNYPILLTTGSINQEDTFEITRRDSGTSTSSKNTSQNTFDDSGKTWTSTFPDNALVGKFIITTGGTGAGQTRLISSYTDTQLTLNSNWASNISTDTTYSLCDEAYRGFVPAGASGWGIVVKEVL